MELLDLDLLDDDDPFEIEGQAAHLFQHPRLGIADLREMRVSAPLFYPAKPPAHWLMDAETAGTAPSGAAGAAAKRRPAHMPSDRLLPGRRILSPHTPDR